MLEGDKKGFYKLEYSTYTYEYSTFNKEVSANIISKLEEDKKVLEGRQECVGGRQEGVV